MTNKEIIMTGAERGTKVGPYELKRKLGAGGFASVWLGEDAIGQSVAVKVLHSKYCQAQKRRGPTVAERFLDEARMLTGLDIPGVVRVLSIIDERERGIIAYTMELLFGSDLAQIFVDLPGATILEIFAVVCETLEQLHEKEIVHRDIKSANIFVSRPDQDNNRTIKLIDFGVAKVLQARSMMESTATGVIVGTIQTLAPESIQRLNGEKVDINWSVDQWGIGIALYHCISGRLPFNDHAVLQLITDIQSKPAPPLVFRSAVTLQGIEHEVEEVIRRCIEKDPANRYPSMLAVANALRGLINKTNQKEGRKTISSRSRQNLSVITIPPSSGIRTDPAHAALARKGNSSNYGETIPTPSVGFSDKNTDREFQAGLGLSDEQSDTLIPKSMADRTEIDMAPDSIQTIAPSMLHENHQENDIGKAELNPNVAASSPWSLRRQSDDDIAQKIPSERPDIAMAPVGESNNRKEQAPTLYEIEKGKRRSGGTADTLPRLSITPELNDTVMPNTKLEVKSRPSANNPPRDSLEPEKSIDLQSKNDPGVSLQSVLILVGVSVLVSFAMGWFLRGL